MNNDFESLLNEIVPKIGEYFKREYAHFFKSSSTLFKSELTMLRLLHELGKRIMQYLIDTMTDTGYEGRTTIRNERQFRFANNIPKQVHCLFGVVEFKRAQYAACDEGKGFAPNDERFGIKKKHTPACDYMLNLFTASLTSHDEALTMFQNVFRSNEANKISLRKAEDMSYALGKEFENEQQDAIQDLFSGRSERINVFSPIDDTAVISIDATKLRHKNGEIIQQRNEKGKLIKKKGFKDVKLVSVSGIARTSNGDVVCENSSYLGAIEHADTFFKRIKVEMIRRKAAACRRKVFICDGAKWIWKRLERLVHESDNYIFILDYYHALEHLALAVEAIEGDRGFHFHERFKKYEQDIYNGDIEIVMKQLQSEIENVSKSQAEVIRKQISYFTENADFMRYDEYRAKGLPIGSGTIESACKNVVGSRMKRGGMTWSAEGASAMLHIRCSIKSNSYYEDYSRFLEKQDKALLPAA